MPTDRPRKRDACDDHDMRQGVNLGTDSDNSLEASWQALGTLYHNFFSGLILSLSSREEKTLPVSGHSIYSGAST